MSIWHRTASATPATLALVCATALGRPIWTAEAAEAHMAAELAQAPKQSLFYPIRTTIQRTLDWGGMGILLLVPISGAFFLLAALCAFVSISADLLLEYRTGVEYGLSSVCGLIAASAFVMFLLSCILAAVAICAITWLTALKLRGPAYWCQFCFGGIQFDSKLRMPAEARRGGELIKQLLPGVTLVVLVLRQDSVILDPVLKAIYINPLSGKREEAYLFVWDKDGNLLEPH